MCGICGKLNFNRQEPVERRLSCRDDGCHQPSWARGSGEYREGPVDWVIGGSASSTSAPATSRLQRGRTIWVVYNEKIYTCRMRQGVGGLGHKFRSTSDTEVIVPPL